jgi:4-hydroxy-tetrahydrodipicolinate reductase
MRRIDCVTLTDFADMSRREQPDMIFRVLPFGRDPASFDEGAPGETPMIAPGSLSMTAAALGLAVDRFVATREFAVARSRVEFAAGSIEAGTIGAMRRTTTGLRNGKPVIRRVSALYVTKDVEPAWNLRDSGQHMTVEGDVPLDVMITMPVTSDVYVATSGGMTANPVVNAVPYVCAAKPGIVHTDELPFMIGRFALKADDKPRNC